MLQSFPALVFLLLQTGSLGPLDGAGLSPYDLERVDVGDVAQDFCLQDENGDVHQLSQYRVKNVVLVIYRGHW